eukprot:1138818-Pelagomonas_calceolata.AAC.5
MHAMITCTPSHACKDHMHSKPCLQGSHTLLAIHARITCNPSHACEGCKGCCMQSYDLMTCMRSKS